MNKMELLSDALEYIENHLENELKTEDVAKACYCSKSTLEKLFRCVNHMTVREYMIRRRMTKAARRLLEAPETGILEVALQYGYSTNESFTRAFKQVWNCRPSEFRSSGTRFSELFPRIKPLENGDGLMAQYKQVDISELYDLFVVRKNCYFVCCDIKNMISINEISRKAGDLAILESMKRMSDAAGEEDIVFRIGGDEFVMLTNTEDEREVEKVAEKIRSRNGHTFEYTAEGENKEAGNPPAQQIPLTLYVSVTKFSQPRIRYNELFTKLHEVIEDGK